MTQSREIVHLHVHTQYSILDGLGKPESWVKKAKKIGSRALAITDHGNICGAIDFYMKAKDVGIKPIIGQEFYTVRDMDKKEKDEKRRHLVLLAKNMKGYNNLLRLSSLGWTRGLYYRPRIDTKLLKKYHNGIIATSACFANEIAQYIISNKVKKAMKRAKFYKKLFGGDFFLELQPHDIDQFRKVNLAYVYISEKLGIPLVVTNDCHYVDKEDSFAQKVLMLIQFRKTLLDAKKGDARVFSTKEFFLKTSDELLDSFREYHPDLYKVHKKKLLKAISITTDIADKCNVKIPLGVPMIPSYGVAKPNSLLKKLCKRGWKKKIRPILESRDKDGYWAYKKQYYKQMKKELKVITDMKLSDYFLIIRDMVAWARKNKIMVGNARGSVAGSLVAYTLGITDIDPIKFGLLFERFLTYDRTGVGNIPDIDLDFQHDRRNEIKSYLEEKWGKDKVASIITFGTMGTRAVLKDVARVFGVDYNKVNSVTKLLTVKDTVKTAQMHPIIKPFANHHKKMFDVSARLEGQIRHYSTHAAGVIITDRPMVEICPLAMRGGNDPMILSQWDMDHAVERGLLKIDLLGLKTLTILKNAIRLIKARHDKKILLNKVSLIDKKVYQSFCGGYTIGVFQFENPDFQELLRNIRPSCIEDLAVANALGRPGAKLAGQDDIYIRNKRKGIKKIKYVHPKLKPILDRTYGAICFQEQIMEMCNKIGNIPIDETNDIRESIKHFKHGVMASFKKKFIKGAKKNNLSSFQAKELWHNVETHSSYSFNRNHATSYSLLSYYTMYLKVYYPHEYMCSLMSSDVGNENQMRKYTKELRRLGIPLWKPDVYASGINFNIKKKSGRLGILSGYLTIKGIGVKTAQKIIALRKEYGKDFLEKVSEGVLKKLHTGVFKLGGKF